MGFLFGVCDVFRNLLLNHHAEITNTCVHLWPDARKVVLVRAVGQAGAQRDIPIGHAAVSVATGPLRLSLNRAGQRQCTLILSVTEIGMEDDSDLASTREETCLAHEIEADTVTRQPLLGCNVRWASAFETRLCLDI